MLFTEDSRGLSSTSYSPEKKTDKALSVAKVGAIDPKPISDSNHPLPDMASSKHFKVK